MSQGGYGHSFRDINDAKAYPLALAKAPSEELYIK
jgi:hypothetical protein